MFGTIGGNILGLIYYLIFQFTGIFLAYILLKKEKLIVKLVIGSVFGSVLFTWLPVIFSFIFNFNYISHICSVITLFPIWIITCKRKVCSLIVNDVNEIRGILKNKQYTLVFSIIITLILIWCYLLYSHTIRYDSDGAIYTGQCGYGDMNMHLGFITSIAKQGDFPPEYSIFPGVPLAYPFLSDSNSSSIYIFGSSLAFAYNLPMLISFLQVLGGFYLIANNFLKSINKVCLALIFYFLNGGFGFVYFINWSKESQYNLIDIFTGFYTTPTNLINENIRWVNVIVDMLLPQRATLFGFSILFSAIYLLIRASDFEEKKYFIISAILGGALPLIHTHSFLCFGLIAASTMLIYLIEKNNAGTVRIPGNYIVIAFIIVMVFIQYSLKKNMIIDNNLMLIAILVIISIVLYGIYQIIMYIQKNGVKELVSLWLPFILLTILLAGPQLIGFTFGQVERGGFVRGCFNWGNQGDFYPWFYIKNMGIVIILGVLSFCETKNKTIRFAFSVFPIWFIAEMIAFAPNNYDNNKLLYVAYVFVSIIAADYVWDIWVLIKRKKGSVCIASIFLFLVSISAILSIGREVYSKLQLYGKDQVEMAKWIESNTNSKDVILTSDRHNNIISSMNGRSIVCGSDAFLYFHGIDASERHDDVKKMYESPQNCTNLFDKYKVSYICYSPYEWGQYEISQEDFDRLFDRAFEYEGTILYKVK